MSEQFANGTETPNQTNINKAYVKFTIMHNFVMLILQKVLDKSFRYFVFSLKLYVFSCRHNKFHQRKPKCEFERWRMGSILTFDEEKCI